MKKKKKEKNPTQPPGETTKELLLNYQNQDWMLKE
jgi:hypothetical protein